MKVLASILILPLLTVCERPTRTWSFDQQAAGQAPAGFEFDTTRDAPAGRWQVVQDGNERVLAQIDRNRSPRRFALAVVRDASHENLRLSVRFKAVEGEVDLTGGIVWRYRDSENYYLLRADVASQKVRLYRVVNGNRIRFAQEENIDLAPNTWHLLKVEQRGDRIKAYLDGEMLLKAKDKTFSGTGRIGLWTQADSVTFFDDLRVEGLEQVVDHDAD